MRPWKPQATAPLKHLIPLPWQTQARENMGMNVILSKNVNMNGFVWRGESGVVEIPGHTLMKQKESLWRTKYCKQLEAPIKNKRLFLDSKSELGLRRVRQSNSLAEW